MSQVIESTLLGFNIPTNLYFTHMLRYQSADFRVMCSHFVLPSLLVPRRYGYITYARFKSMPMALFLFIIVVTLWVFIWLPGYI